MKISEFAKLMGLEVLVLPNPDAEVTGGYTGDLLSWVMGRAKTGQVWITIMTNINILAVATLSLVSAIVITEQSEVAPEIISKAEEEGINLLRSDKTTFDVAVATGKLLGI